MALHFELFARGPGFLFNTNGSSMLLSGFETKWQYYNDGSEALIDFKDPDEQIVISRSSD